MLPVDLDAFWAKDEEAHKDNCFNPAAQQVALGIRMSGECVFAELNEEGEQWGHTPRERRMELNKRYNDISEKIVGKRLLQEYFPTKEELFPGIKQIGEVFGGRYVYEAGTTWLHGSCQTPAELEAVLDTVDKMNFPEFVLPKNWESEKRRLFEAYGKKPGGFHSVRGPVTLATSIYGVENLMFLYYDEPDLYKRFSDTILKVIMNYIDLMDAESGIVATGFGFYDDNCYLMTPEMYEEFGYPILKAVFEKRSPGPNQKRYQHSDSAMGHLLPLLGKLNLTGTNFGPTLTVDEIRKHLPNARIDGQLAPFTFMNNDQDAIIAEVKRDCEQAINGGYRGLNIATAGSINNGSSIESMRAVMYAIEQYGQYR
ncbi:uroporphyrinogen decarboxylase family protein [Candidatus Epulonipiscium viviparus]|uniref:uroporphyrinogen decarboxylase family protein n=1 Tax=Candidatus Epulonipiscium viviparus TaxID=420336 RepID=UPI0027380D0C|nr:uroporphyrinogen decarboxylase family protein [Candidatus Epulopiscium viviparus]